MAGIFKSHYHLSSLATDVDAATAVRSERATQQDPNTVLPDLLTPNHHQGDSILIQTSTDFKNNVRRMPRDVVECVVVVLNVSK